MCWETYTILASRKGCCNILCTFNINAFKNWERTNESWNDHKWKNGKKSFKRHSNLRLLEANCYQFYYYLSIKPQILCHSKIPGKCLLMKPVPLVVFHTRIIQCLISFLFFNVCLHFTNIFQGRILAPSSRASHHSTNHFPLLLKPQK